MPIWRHLTSSPRLNGSSQNPWIRHVQVTPEETPAPFDLRSTEIQECSKSCKLRLLHCEARVAKLADARDLKSRVSKETYRFNSGPGHQNSPADTPMSRGVGRTLFCAFEKVFTDSNRTYQEIRPVTGTGLCETTNP